MGWGLGFMALSLGFQGFEVQGFRVQGFGFGERLKESKI